MVEQKRYVHTLIHCVTNNHVQTRHTRLVKGLLQTRRVVLSRACPTTRQHGLVGEVAMTKHVWTTTRTKLDQHGLV